MKRFLVFAAMLAAVNAFGQAAKTDETISVTGVGHATLVPDRFSFTGSVRTTAPTVEDAVNQNNARVQEVIAALKHGGATSEEIHTSNFSIYPQQVYQQGQPPRVTGYQVMNSITVTKKDVAAAGKLLQVAIAAGINEASSLTFDVSDRARGRDEGLRAAFDDARAQAVLLAQAAGRTLGRAMVISGGGSFSPPPPRPMAVRAMAAPGVSSEVPVESGMTELTYTVSVVFAMQ